MRSKLPFHLLSWVTLLVFPAIGLFLLWIFGNRSIESLLSVFEIGQLLNPINLLGLEFGLFYGALVIAISQMPLFDDLSDSQTHLLKRLNLNWADIIFVSFCAGFGEEILFRASLQTWLGPWLTSFVFIAVHGYFSIKPLKKNLMGLLLFPFILIISFAYETFGLWFCVAAHFSYDLLMFIGVLTQTKKRF